MSPRATPELGINRLIHLPNREAVKIALRSIRIRFWRSLITIAGILLAIAFLSYVMTSALIQQSLEPQPGEQAAVVEQERATQMWLIAISLLVCVVGITNAMLMSVTERYREIGTMKCLGALDWFVVKLFLIEAAVQGLSGSAVGAVAGHVVAILASMTEHGATVLHQTPWSKALLNLAVAIGVGGILAILGAIYPARRAGKMPPAEAMRTEI